VIAPPSAGPASRAGAGPAVAIFALALVSQILSATFLVRDVSSPNAATVIATSIVERGEFAARAWPRAARSPDGSEAPLRAYHLPAEPVLLATGLAVLPQSLTPYLHVPITALFVLAVATMGFRLGGRPLGFAAGFIAAFDPFVLAHGAVWDDAFLAAALEWSAFALLVKRAAADTTAPPIRSAVTAGLIAMAAGLAALTRASSSVVLAAVALTLVARPRFRELRAAGWTVLAAVAVALSGWGLRNVAVLGEFHVGSSHDGITLLESNYATARPSIFRTGIAESYVIDDLAPHFEAAARMSELDANRYFTQQAIAYARREPLDVLATAAVKFLSSVSGVNFGQPVTTPRNLVVLGANLALLAAAALGWRVWRIGRRGTPVILAVHVFGIVLAVTALALLAGPVGLRYRISAAPVLYLCAAAWLSRVSPSTNAVAGSGDAGLRRGQRDV
jgi:hypothetical protein